jgi:hypothetical protein
VPALDCPLVDEQARTSARRVAQLPALLARIDAALRRLEAGTFVSAVTAIN